MDFIETSLGELYDSAVEAFPRTTMRQYATHTIKITNLRWTPFLGTKVLFVKALAQNEGREYFPTIIFKNVLYNSNDDPVRIIASDGQVYQFKKLSIEHTDTLVRCQCGDFNWRFNFFNHIDKSLYGRKRKKYESKGIGPPANPLGLPGVCKHLIKTGIVLIESGIFRDALQKY